MLSDGIVFEQEKTYTSPDKLRDRSREKNTVTDTDMTYTKLASGLYTATHSGSGCIAIDGLPATLKGASKGTITGWFNIPDATPASASTIFSMGDTNASEYIFVQVQTDGDLQVNCRIAATNQWILRSTGLYTTVNDKAYHYALVQDGTEAVMYRDGILFASSFTVDTDKTKWVKAFAGLDNARIGCRNDSSAGNTQFMTGSTILHKVWNRALSAGEILTLYNQEKGYFGL